MKSYLQMTINERINLKNYFSLLFPNENVIFLGKKYGSKLHFESWKYSSLLLSIIK